jgi:hypothetical protein
MSTPDDYEFYLEDPMPEAEFYQWVGRYIKEWARAEETLFTICHRILGCELKRAAIVYFRTPTIDARLSLADELVLAVLPQRKKKDGGHDHRDVERWKEVVKGIRNLLPIRNILAHARVGRPHSSASFARDDDQPGDVETTWFEVATNWQEQLRGRPGIFVIDRDLPGHLDDIKSALSELDAFSAFLKKRYVKKKPPGESGAYTLPLPSHLRPASTRTRQAKQPRPRGSSRA